MRSKAMVSAACLAACAGTVVAQPTIDGKLAGDEALYGKILWVQNVPTGFGDNLGGDPCDPDEVGDPAAVKTGVELAIPLSALGNPQGAIRIFTAINGSGHDFLSNQMLGGLAAGTSNLGDPRNVNLKDFAGVQHVAFTPQTINAAPVIDGAVDAIYGAPLAVQINGTGFGDSNLGDIGAANGSEVDGLYARVNAGVLYIAIAGNVESNFNKLEIFFDTVAGGQNKLEGTNPDIDFNGLNRMGDDGSGNGLEFDTGFTADYYITFGGGGDPYALYPNFAEVKAGGAGYYLGAGGAGTDGTLSGGTNPDGIRLTINNSNTAGVPASCPPPPSEDVATGSEIDGVYGFTDAGAGKLYLLVTGNLQNGAGGHDSNSGNKIILLADVQAGGQNRLRGDNVDISYGILNRMGDDGSGNGLAFDEEFTPDYWMSLKTNDNPVWQILDSAVLRTDGPLQDFSGNHLDYGAWDYNEKSDGVPIPYDGPRVDIQDGFTPQIYTNFGPRTTQKDPNNPVPGLLLMYLNNSNTGGVTSDDASKAALVTTGAEYCLDLSELGWDGSSEIKIAGFVVSEDGSYLSNQVIGGLPDGSGNLEEVRSVNFANIKGTQYLVIPAGGCYPDCDGNGELDFFDFLCFINAFDNADPYADCEAGGEFDFFDFLCFINSFDAGC